MLRASLVDEWGLDGFVISDADAVAQIGPGSPQAGGFEPGHNFVPSLYEAAISALRNGTTISLESDGSATSSACVCAASSLFFLHYYCSKCVSRLEGCCYLFPPIDFCSKKENLGSFPHYIMSLECR